MFHPWKVIRFPASGNPGLWNPESQKRLKPEIQVPLTQNQNPVPGIRNPSRGIQIPKFSWIPLHEAMLHKRKLLSDFKS